MPTIKDPNAKTGDSLQRKEYFVEDSQGGGGPHCRTVTIGVLPDDALLEIFIFYLEEAYKADRMEAWHALVHVCQRWRRVVFASPRRLNLRLVCTSSTPVREMLDIWPTFPIAIQDLDPARQWMGVDSVIAALEHRDRVCQIALERLPHFHSEWDPVLLESFPNLTHLFLHSEHLYSGICGIPDSFLGGSAPQLRELVLGSIPFPALPKLLLSTDNLVVLDIGSTYQYSGYISPETMATCLSSLTRLTKLSFGSSCHNSPPDESSRRPPPMTRVNLPALLKLQIHGVSEYIEDFVARINAPLLFNIKITYFNFMHSDTSQLSQFTNRIEIFKGLHQARVQFCERDAVIKFARADYTATLEFRLRSLDAQVQPVFLVDLCRSFTFPVSPSVERLDIVVDHTPPRGWYDHWHSIEISIWFGLLPLFTAVKDLYLSEEIALPAMQESIGENITQVLPVLRNIFVEGYDLSEYAAIRPFIAMQQSSSHLVTVHSWDRRQEDDD